MVFYECIWHLRLNLLSHALHMDTGKLCCGTSVRGGFVIRLDKAAVGSCGLRDDSSCSADPIYPDETGAERFCDLKLR